MAPPREPINAPPLADIAARGGLVVGRGGFAPCPLCGAEHRGREDKRRPVAVFPGRDGERWKCHACGAGGDAIQLAAAVRWREVPGKGDPRWAELFAELRGEAGPGLLSRPAPKAPPRPVAPSPPPASVFLPGDEVAALWAACVPVAGREVVDTVTGRTRRAAREWLERVRGLSPDLVTAADLARVLPGAYTWPAWIPSAVRKVLPDGPAADVRPYALAVPVYDARGVLRALRFRAVDRVATPDADGAGLTWTETGIERGRKAIASRSNGGRYRVAAGLVMADPMALALLRHQDAGPVEALEARWSGRVVVLEGEPAWWAYATHPDRFRAGTDGRPETFATFGIEAGAWTPDIAARLPSSARVLVWTDYDAAGDRYFEAVRGSFAGRVEVCRAKRPSQWGDRMTPEKPTKELQPDDLARRGELPHPDDVPTVDDGPADGPPSPGDGDAPTGADGGPAVDPLADIEERAARLDGERVGTFADDELRLMRGRGDGSSNPVPMPPGWSATIAELRGGLWPGCYVLVGSTGTGKTQWAFEVAYHATTGPLAVPVLYIGLELDRGGMLARLAALAVRTREPSTRINWSDVYVGNDGALAHVERTGVLAEIGRAPLYLVRGEARGWPYTDLDRRVEALRHRHPVGPTLVILDFLQLVSSPPGGREDIRERIGAAAYAARMAAVHYDATVLVLSATARGFYPLFAGSGKADDVGVSPLGSGDTARFLGTGKEAGEVEYAADGVLALCREPWPDNGPAPRSWLAVAKARTGRVGTGWIGYGFDGTSFTEDREAKPLPPKGRPGKANNGDAEPPASGSQSGRTSDGGGVRRPRDSGGLAG